MNRIPRDGTSRRLGRELLAGLVVVFLLFGPYLSQFLRVGPHLRDMLGRNALWFLWQPQDVFILSGCMLGLALTAVLVRELLRRWRWPLRVFDHLFVVALGAGVLANLWFHTQRPKGYHIGQFGMETQTAWLVLVGIVAYSLASPRSRLVRRCVNLCLIVSPALLIVAYQLVQAPALPQRMDPLIPAGGAADAQVMPAGLTGTAGPARPSVYLFLFDEWSYARTFDGGRLRPEFSNLARLARQSIVFHEAHSPAKNTTESIPAILRGTPDGLEFLDGKRPGFLSGGQFIPSTQLPSIFTTAGCRDYRKIMVQFGFATSLWVADELDVCRAYAWNPRGENSIESAALHLYNAAFFWTDPWSRMAYEKLRLRIEDGHLLGLYTRMRADVTSIIRDQAGPTFAMVHYPIPHSPYLVNADGSYRGCDQAFHELSNVDGYQHSLAYVDTLVGEIVRDLEAAGRFEQSLLILTSDHSWRREPGEQNPDPEKLTHVPLVVKLPGQTQPLTIDTDFRSYRLGELIGRALREPRAPDKLAQWVDSLPPGSKIPLGAGVCVAGSPGLQTPEPE